MLKMILVLLLGIVINIALSYYTPKMSNPEQHFLVLPITEQHTIPAEKIPDRTVESIGLQMEIPSISTNSKLFTDYRKYNLPWTPHYRLQQVAYTDSEGLRRYKDDYIVAMGSYYSTSIGDRFKITLETGNSFTVMFGDGKWDSDCDERKMYMPWTNYDGEIEGNLLEFIIDEDIIDPNVYEYGGVEKIEFFNGSITKIEYLGRNEDYDWDTYF